MIENRKSRATEKLNIIAGLLDNKIIAPLTYNCSTTSLVFNNWLEKCFIPILPTHCVIVMDNASFHKSSKTKKLLKIMGIDFFIYQPIHPI